MHELNEKQREAADFMFGTASVIAIPGSGKTLTMAARIGNLVKSGIPPDKILGLSFTRNAAWAMRDKLQPVLYDQAASVTLSTIHAFCHRLLQETGCRFKMLYGKRQIYLVRKVIKRLRLNDLTAGFMLREIGTAKCRLICAQSFDDFHRDNETMAPVAKVYLAYEEEKRKRLLLDFHDLLLETHTLLSQNADMRNSYRQAFPHILVDEYQDTNPAQVEILNLLTNESEQSSFWVCGDDWQSIFSFTGAQVENILQFADRHPASTRFILDINYRSSPQILSACQYLIDRNERKIEKQLNTINPDGENVIVLDAMSEEDEAEKIVTEIRDLVEGQGFEYRDIAVLYRANAQSRAIEEALSKHDIAYRIESEANFYRRYEVRILLAYLRLVEGPDTFDGNDALKTIINVPSRYIGHRFIETLEAYAESNDLHLYPALKVMPVRARYLQQGIKAFTRLIDYLIHNKTWLEPVGLLGHIRVVLDFDRYLANELAEPFTGPVESLDKLQMAAGWYENLAEFLEYADSVRSSGGNDENGVTLSTIHKSKGLEFPVVFVIGMVNGVLPNAKGDPEEERRIAFVAMSRARHLLYLSWSRSYLERLSKKSPFINEALKRKEGIKA